MATNMPTGTAKNPEFLLMEFDCGQLYSDIVIPLSLSDDLKQELLHLLKVQGLVNPNATLDSFSKVDYNSNLW